MEKKCLVYFILIINSYAKEKKIHKKAQRDTSVMLKIKQKLKKIINISSLKT